MKENDNPTPPGTPGSGAPENRADKKAEKKANEFFSSARSYRNDKEKRLSYKWEKTRYAFYIVIPVCVFIMFICFIGLSIATKTGWNKMTMEMSYSTNYAAANNAMKCEYNGERIRINPENAYNIFITVRKGGAAKMGIAPKNARVIHYDYGNGTTMDVYETPKGGVFISYKGEKSYGFYVGSVSSFSDVVRLSSVEGINIANSYWEEQR